MLENRSDMCYTALSCKRFTQGKIMKLLTSIFVLMLSVLTACNPAYVTGTKIQYTPQKQVIADFIEKYRVAVENRNLDLLKSMVSETYYENGSTTNDPKDDYDFQGLLKVFTELGQQIRAVKYEIKIEKIEILDENLAAVDFNYNGQYLFAVKEQERWATQADKNRITLKKEEGKWMIVSGL
jgi:hypothetical protein